MYDSAYYRRDIPETWFWQAGLLRPDQLAALCYAKGWPFWGNDSAPRDPGVIYSIGAGRGELEATLEKLGHHVVGVDPSPGAREMYEGSVLLDAYPGGGDTVIFCESIEHLQREEFEDIWEQIPEGARVIIVNWPDYHPLEPDGSGWDHVRLIDDRFFDELTEGRKVILRHGSHLVVEK